MKVKEHQSESFLKNAFHKASILSKMYGSLPTTEPKKNNRNCLNT